jgi:plasmid stabilization system protein ParE
VNLWVHPEALADLADAREFYREQAGAKLAASFINEFERIAQVLLTYPWFGTTEASDIRKQPMRRFPYTVVYRPLVGEIRVLAVAHQSRKPRFWRGRR